ncbi:hypothetical protein ABZT43_12640 [Streptomyces sp. NPDC005349]|uniref:hypothetical protein n=1 Tax=Streptomyces sp. NPDC005349 TaxID=3157037 RepID=UPI00339DF9D2
MKKAINADAAAASAAMQKTIRKASNEGSRACPTTIVTEASTVAITALDVELPMERMRLFSPFAAAVCVTGTAPMMSEGAAA